ncbi:hypothetical protein Rs2_24802 [Raphanus sativus]|nr:hypothetical protein Rs2_24802 [Raphanus sativus]
MGRSFSLFLVLSPVFFTRKRFDEALIPVADFFTVTFGLRYTAICFDEYSRLQFPVACVYLRRSYSALVPRRTSIRRRRRLFTGFFPADGSVIIRRSVCLIGRWFVRLRFRERHRRFDGHSPVKEAKGWLRM